MITLYCQRCNEPFGPNDNINIGKFGSGPIANSNEIRLCDACLRLRHAEVFDTQIEGAAGELQFGERQTLSDDGIHLHFGLGRYEVRYNRDTEDWLLLIHEKNTPAIVDKAQGNGVDSFRQAVRQALVTVAGLPTASRWDKVKADVAQHPSALGLMIERLATKVPKPK
ncbi:hypothetical protein [Candidatus Binatus sp.]|uniref:hypothetical protein n=1 Tax=Candidatus Binatus sp. TaxID=2811406 RepID=UPI003C6EBCF4